jgi:hypothetical protein
MPEKLKKILKSLVVWYLINLILPIAVPVFFLWACSYPTGTSYSFYEIFMELLRNGFYIFTSTLLVVSIFQDSEVAKKEVEWYDNMALFGFLFVVGILYMSDNPINKISKTFDFKNEFETVKGIFLFGIIFAGYMKLKILWHQQYNEGITKSLKRIINKYAVLWNL